MRYRYLKEISLIIACLGLTGIQAQSVIPATGGNIWSYGGSVSYSVGQVFYSFNTSPANGSVLQGAQQPYEISVVTSTEEVLRISLNCNVYPNPANDFIKLQVENEKLTNLSYQLFDISGQLLTRKKVINNETTISMENLVSATYFLEVTINDKLVKTFKIIKK